MIHFLRTSFLFALAVAAIPLLIHLFAKRQRTSLSFSSVMFFKQMETRQMRAVNIRSILLLVIRMLALALLVLAFAGPVLSGRLPSSGKGKSLVLVDRSRSMERNGMFDEARSTARDILADNQGEAGMYFFPGKERNIVTGSPAELSEILRHAETVPGIPDMKRFMGPAQAYVQAHTGVSLVIVTDGQRCVWYDGDSLAVFPAVNGSVFIVQLSDSTRNAAVTGIDVYHSIANGMPAVKVRARLAGSVYGPVPNALVRLYIDGTAAEQRLAHLAAGEQRSESFVIAGSKPGWHTGRITIQADDIGFDNTGYFSFFIPERGRILVLGSGTADVEPLKTALETVFHRHHILTAMYSDSWWINSIDSCAAVFISNVPSFSFRQGAALAGAIDRGLHVVYFPGTAADIRNLTESAFWPGEVFNVTGVQTVSAGEDRSFSVTDIDREHPVFSGVFADNNTPAPEAGTVLKRLRIQMKYGAPLMTFSDGKPFIAEAKNGKGTFVLCATGLGDVWSDLYASPLFPVFTVRYAAHAMSAGAVNGGRAFAGEVLSGRVLPGPGQYGLIFPDSTEILFNADETAEPVYLAGVGNYSVKQAGTLLSVLSVNTCDAESDFSQLESGEYKKIFPNAHVHLLDGTGDIAGSIQRLGTGIVIWKFLLMAVLALLAAEMLAARVKG